MNRAVNDNALLRAAIRADRRAIFVKASALLVSFTACLAGTYFILTHWGFA